MVKPNLQEAATRLGSMYSELLRAGHKLDESCLPSWMVPVRLRPLGGGFGIRANTLVALSMSPLYYSPLGKSYVRSDTIVRANRIQYDLDLRVFHSHLEPAVAQVASNGLLRMEKEIRALNKRFSRPGIAEFLHVSAVRIWDKGKNREILPGGIEDPSPPVSQNHQAANESTEVLPGGVNIPNSTQPKSSPKSIPLISVPRFTLLRYIKEERQILEGHVSEPLDPREARAMNESIEISNLLALIAVHPNSVSILRAYAESPEKGTVAILDEIEKAAGATQKLRERLTTQETKDDAWGYAPLVVGAIKLLGLQEVPGVPEFAVALGRLLAMTMTTTLMGAATMLIMGLSIAFTGPLGVFAVATLDLALAGVDLGITLLRMHEQEIVATASDFAPEDQKLAEHTSGEDAALSVAAAFLSAIALAGPAKQLLKTRPRSPEVLKHSANEAGRAKLPKKQDLDPAGIGNKMVDTRSVEARGTARVAESPIESVAARPQSTSSGSKDTLTPVLEEAKGNRNPATGNRIGTSLARRPQRDTKEWYAYAQKTLFGKFSDSPELSTLWKRAKQGIVDDWDPARENFWKLVKNDHSQEAALIREMLEDAGFEFRSYLPDGTAPVLKMNIPKFNEKKALVWAGNDPRRQEIIERFIELRNSRKVPKSDKTDRLLSIDHIKARANEGALLDEDNLVLMILRDNTFKGAR